MKAYFIRRLLLIPPTLLGITLLIFAVTRFVPGGPMDRVLQEAAGNAEQGGRQSSTESQGGLTEEQIEALEEQFGLNRPTLVAYLQWLGVLPREVLISKGEFGASGTERFATGEQKISAEQVATVVLRGDGRLVLVERDGQRIVSARFAEPHANDDLQAAGWKLRYESEAERKARFMKRSGRQPGIVAPNYRDRVVMYQERLSGVLQGDLGRSTVYQDPVIEMILERVPVAVYFGLLTAIITYGVCLPLGIVKALKHRTWIDSLSSVIIFIGYSIPGFALGAILLVHFGVNLNWFPLFGLTSPNFDELSLWGKICDVAHHTVLPLLCYLVGSFAMLTMLTKNNLMEELAADYVRTAVAKGVGFRRAVFSHAFRNAMIPIATSIGGLLGIFIGGSMLVETVFDIQGFGLLQYQSVLARDVPVIMGTLSIAALLMLLGNVISDIAVAMVDPRIEFK